MNINHILYAQKKSVIDRNMAVIANNLANINTTAFQENMPINESNAISTKSKPLFNYPSHCNQTHNTSLGSIKPTGSKLDVALNIPNTYLLAADHNGTTLLSRDGSLSLNTKRQLVMASNSYPLLDENGSSITLPQNINQINISDKGVIYADGEVIGKMGIVSIPNDQMHQLEKIGNNMFAVNEDTPLMQSDNVEVLQGYLEGSNVQPIIAMTHMMQLQQTNSQMQQMIEMNTKQTQESTERLLISI